MSEQYDIAKGLLRNVETRSATNEKDAQATKLAAVTVLAMLDDLDKKHANAIANYSVLEGVYVRRGDEIERLSGELDTLKRSHATLTRTYEDNNHFTQNLVVQYDGIKDLLRSAEAKAAPTTLQLLRAEELLVTKKNDLARITQNGETVEIPVGRRSKATAQIPRFMYHDVRSRGFNAEGGVSPYQHRDLVHVADSFPGETTGLVWLSRTPLSEGAVRVDMRALDLSQARGTGQAEGNVVYRGTIPPDAIKHPGKVAKHGDHEQEDHGNRADGVTLATEILALRSELTTTQGKLRVEELSSHKAIEQLREQLTSVQNDLRVSDERKGYLQDTVTKREKAIRVLAEGDETHLDNIKGLSHERDRLNVLLGEMRAERDSLLVLTLRRPTLGLQEQEEREELLKKAASLLNEVASPRLDGLGYHIVGNLKVLRKVVILRTDIEKVLKHK